MEYVSDSSFAWNNHSFFIKFISITIKHILRPNKERISSVCNSILAITIACPNLSYLTHLHPPYFC